MTNSFGAGFFTLTLLAVLAGLAGLLGLTAVVAAMLRRRSGQVPSLLRYVAVALLVGVVAPAAFGVLVLSDEAAIAAGLIVGLVFMPLAAGVVRGWEARRRWLDTFSAAAMAWSLPYLLGLAVFLAIDVGVIEAFQLSGGETRALGLSWIAGAGGAVAAVAGTVLLEERVTRWLSASPAA